MAQDKNDPRSEAQKAAERAAVKGKDPNKAYNDKLKELGQKPDSNEYD